MSCFILHFVHNVTVPKASINELALDPVSPIRGTVEHVDNALDFWCKDLVGLASGQVAQESKNWPAGFSRLLVDLIICADHGQGSFCANVKVICRQADLSIEATALCDSGKSNAQKKQASFWHWHSSPKQTRR
jgi:hypothetical protein